MPELEDASDSTGGSGAQMSHISGIGAGRPGSVPFVSHRPGAYGRLLWLFMCSGRRACWWNLIGCIPCT